MCGSMNSVGFGSNDNRISSLSSPSGGGNFNSSSNNGISMPAVDLTRGSQGGSSFEIDG